MSHDKTSHSLYAELFRRYPDNPILTAADWPYLAHTVFNAGACQIGDTTLLLVRVEDRRGHSHLTVARSRDGITNWQIDSKPSFAPDAANYAEEAWGVEDPRLTWVAERAEWIIAYTAYSPSGPMVSLASTKDFVSFKRLGPVMPPEDKDAAVFPRRFGDRYAMIHRPVSSGSSGAHIWLSFSPDLTHWGDHHVLLNARMGAWWDANKIGLSPPPLETPEGWLILYHGVRHTPGGCLYRLGLALLDLENPWHVLRRSDDWIFAPEMPYERQGDVNGVVFPCGWILDQASNTIRMYYGGADTCICLATAQLSDVLHYLHSCPTPSQRKLPSMTISRQLSRLPRFTGSRPRRTTQVWVPRAALGCHGRHQCDCIGLLRANGPSVYIAQAECLGSCRSAITRANGPTVCRSSKQRAGPLALTVLGYPYTQSNYSSAD